jgi:hypothetical protein
MKIIMICLAVICGLICISVSHASPMSLSQSKTSVGERIRQLQQEARQVTLSCGGEARIAEIFAQIDELNRQNPQPRHRDGALDQGGEACSDARVITALPFCDTGTTVGAVDDYAPPPNCVQNSNAPDVVYAYTPTVTQAVDVSLCGSSYNTVLHIWDGCPYTGIPPVCCNDDAGSCAPASCCPAVIMYAGQTYYIVVDGAGTASGSYILHVEPAGPLGCPSGPCLTNCVVNCPPGATQEGEGCPPSFPDYYNAGCYGFPFAATPISCGQTICATSYWDSLNQDHDAYIITLTQRDSLSWCIFAQFDVQIELHQYFAAG